jgi:hypothetical protein
MKKDRPGFNHLPSYPEAQSYPLGAPGDGPGSESLVSHPSTAEDSPASVLLSEPAQGETVVTRANPRRL